MIFKKIINAIYYHLDQGWRKGNNNNKKNDQNEKGMQR